MGLISDIGKAAIKTITAPVRFVGNVAKMAGNALQIVGNLATGDLEGAKRNLGELGKAAKGALFSGVESAFLFAGGAAAFAAKGTLGAAAASMGTKVGATAAAKETGKAFVTGYAETKMG